MIRKKKFSPIAVGAMILIAINASIAASLSNINADDSTSDMNTDEQPQRRSKSINNKDDNNQASFVLNKVDKLNRRLDTNQLYQRRIKAAQSTKTQQTLPKEHTTNAIEKANNNDAQQRRLNQDDSLYYKILKEDHINEVGTMYYKSHYDNMIAQAQATDQANDNSNSDNSSNIKEESNLEEEEENTGWGPFVEHIEDEIDTAQHAHIIHHSATIEDEVENVVDPSIICPDERTPIPNTYCGRDGKECDEGQFCHVHPTDKYAVCCRNDEEDGDTPSPSPSPEMTSYNPSSYFPSSIYGKSGKSGSASYEPTPVYSTDMPTSFNSGKCTAKDRMIWIANEGETTRPEYSKYCFEKYPYDINGEGFIHGCGMDNTCLEICWQTEYGYTTDCSECFANIHQCSMNNGCMEVCSTNMTSVECIECDEPCIDELYDCTGFPQVPNTSSSGKSGKSGAGSGGKGGKSGVDGKSGKSG